MLSGRTQHPRNTGPHWHDRPAGTAAIPTVTSTPPVLAPPSGTGHPTQPGPDGHWKHPVIYMSRATTVAVWQLLYGTEPDLSGDLRFGITAIPVLFDDRMPLGEARLEEDPEPITV